MKDLKGCLLQLLLLLSKMNALLECKILSVSITAVAKCNGITAVLLQRQRVVRTQHAVGSIDLGRSALRVPTCVGEQVFIRNMYHSSH